MKTDWRISTVNGALLAAYFVPAWTIVAFNIIISPVHGFFDRPNVSVAIFLSDTLQFGTMNTIRFAWLLAFGKLTVVSFLTVFLFFLTRPKIRRSGDCDEALWMGLGIGSLFSFASMLMASRVGETAAMRLHAAELLLMLGGLIILAIDPPIRRRFRQPESLPVLPLSIPSS
jgi:hypothetical protein